MFWQKTIVIMGGPLLVSVLLVLGLYDGLFHTTMWYDILMHSLTGGLFVISSAGMGWHLWLKHRSNSRIGLGLRVGMIAWLLFVSILWEILEVLLGMTPNWTTSVPDTVSDVIYALIGGVVTLCLIRSPGDITADSRPPTVLTGRGHAALHRQKPPAEQRKVPPQ